MSPLIRRVVVLTSREGPDLKSESLKARPDLEGFFWALGLLPVDDPERKTRLVALEFVFLKLCEDALAIDPNCAAPMAAI